MMCVEAFVLAGYEYVLYGLSPADSVGLSRSIQGYNRMGLLNSLFMTLFIAGSAVLLPDPTFLTHPALLVPLLVAYIGVGCGVVVPRLGLQSIVRAVKARELAPLQRQLDGLLSRLGSLSEEERGDLKFMADIHDRIQASRENLLPLGGSVQIVGTLFLPTLTFLLSVVGEAYLGMFFQRLLR